MQEKSEPFPSVVTKVLGMVPSDVRLIAQRFHDHALEPRLSPEETAALVAELGYDSIGLFCIAAGLPEHLAVRWSRFGISGEMHRVLRLMAAQRRAVAEAIEEFESMTHVGIDDYMRDRGLV